MQTGDASFYVLCLDNQNSMLNLAVTIKQLVINLQRANGQIVLNSKDKPPEAGDLLNQKSERDKLEKQQLLDTASGTLKGRGDGSSSVKVQSPLDGYWITLQGWSTCSLKCGGGTQSYHRMCVPPKSGGKPCQGEAILIKRCNEQPCPAIKDAKDKSKENEETPKPIIKVMPFSSRYQKYTVSIFFLKIINFFNNRNALLKSQMHFG